MKILFRHHFFGGVCSEFTVFLHDLPNQTSQEAEERGLPFRRPLAVPPDAGDLGSICGSGRSPGEGNGYPLQYSYLENPTGRGAWWAIVHGVTKSRTRLSD